MSRNSPAMEFMDVGPVHRVGGSITLPGSKSISNRTLLLAALATGTTSVEDVLDSDDTRVMLEALRCLGIRCEVDSRRRSVEVIGSGGAFPVKRAELFLGNAGTAFRPLTAVLALCGGDFRLSGVPRMHERPIAHLVDALRSIGANVSYVDQEGFPPIAIGKGVIRIEGNVRIRGDVSSQFLSSLLMALPLAGMAAKVEVIGDLISKPYVDITLNQMGRFGVEVERMGWTEFRVPAASFYRSPGSIFVEGDASSASYFLAAGAIGCGGQNDPVRVEGVGRGSIQGDVRFVEVLQQMGARISMGENWIQAEVSPGGLRGVDIECNHIPDAAMTIAVVALFAKGPTTLRGIGSWRVKETDRIHAMATELRKFGADVSEGPDYLNIVPPRDGQLTDRVEVSTYDDHRIAMCFSLVALGGVSVRILDPKCVAKTYPEYFADFAKVVA